MSFEHRGVPGILDGHACRPSIRWRRYGTGGTRQPWKILVRRPERRSFWEGRTVLLNRGKTGVSRGLGRRRCWPPSARRVGRGRLTPKRGQGIRAAARGAGIFRKEPAGGILAPHRNALAGVTLPEGGVPSCTMAAPTHRVRGGSATRCRNMVPQRLAARNDRLAGPAAGTTRGGGGDRDVEQGLPRARPGGPYVEG